jgi:hypothetical protein
MVEYILCYGGPAEHWDLLPVTRIASSKILIEQNIKKRTGPALCVLCGRGPEGAVSLGERCTGKDQQEPVFFFIEVNKLGERKTRL